MYWQKLLLFTRPFVDVSLTNLLAAEEGLYSPPPPQKEQSKHTVQTMNKTKLQSLNAYLRLLLWD